MAKDPKIQKDREFLLMLGYPYLLTLSNYDHLMEQLLHVIGIQHAQGSCISTDRTIEYKSLFFLQL